MSDSRHDAPLGESSLTPRTDELKARIENESKGLPYETILHKLVGALSVHSRQLEREIAIDAHELAGHRRFMGNDLQDVFDRAEKAEKELALCRAVTSLCCERKAAPSEMTPTVGETPRTDVYSGHWATYWHNGVTIFEHARTLERELAEAKRYGRTMEGENGKMCVQINAALDRLQAAESALAAAVLDAERYRWLRNSINQSEAPFIAIRSPSHIVGQLKGEYADQYIDAARKEGQ